jgi:hypothetical protein
MGQFSMNCHYFLTLVSVRASPLFRAKLARHELDRGRSSNGAPLQMRQAKFRSRAPHILTRGRHSPEPGGTLAVPSFRRI